ncbi:single-stranded-DNA-specific exonuclease RecJ [bacterium]|nr:single-stranded-DNA-specific exonuclease RecJ [bacterium]
MIRSSLMSGHKKNTPIPKILKRVRVREQVLEAAEEISYSFSLSPLTSRVLSARGFSVGEDLKNYLVPTLKSGLPDPSQLKNIEAAAEAILEYGTQDRGIAIACDFDVDGLSGGSLVHDFLKKAGIRSQVYVPDRFHEGYGLNERIVLDAKKHGHKVLLTIDYGTTNGTELELARSHDLFTIVIDHHHVRENPPADIFVNPHQEGCGFAEGTLCAAGLGWYLIVVLNRKLQEEKYSHVAQEKKEHLDPKKYLDLACLGTICDMVPLRGANRIIARRGLENLSKTERVGLNALKSVIGARGNITCSNVSFGIGPRLNAAGRMVSGELVIDLLTTNSEKKAEKLAKKLHRLNLERQATEEKVKTGALQQIQERQSSSPDGLPDGLVVWDKDFHTGVIGIVAQRLVEHFYRPAAVLGYDDGKFKGSVRGIKGMSVVELLSRVQDHLIQFGGHDGAGGFSLAEENVEMFARAFEAESKEMLKDIETHPTVEADTECNLSELTPAVVRELRRFEPLGIGNPSPQLLLRSLKVKSIKLLKDAHIKATLSDGKHEISGMMWRTVSHPALVVGHTVDIVGKADLNTYFGNTEMQINLQAVQLSQ